MKNQLFGWLIISLLALSGCQKELSFEASGTPAEGSLQDDGTGDCMPKTVNGTYAVGQALVPDANTVTVAVNVTKTGNYTIATDTVNGYYFRATGIFTTTGITNVTLRGNGTPFAQGVNNFIVGFDSTYCDIQVTVTALATYTLSGAPNACTGAQVSGAYAKDVALTAANTVQLNVNVTAPGSYSISTTFQGMTFSANGVFATTGAQTVTLTGSGTPTTLGANVVPITVGSSTCSFTVTVVAAGAATLAGAPGACTPVNVAGTYTAGTALVAANKVTVTIDVTTAGAINISTNTVNGYTFSFSGNIATTGSQTVDLIGTGTPTLAGTNTFTVTLGASSCTFPVTVTGGGGGAAVFTVDCATAVPDGLYEATSQLNGSNIVDIDVNVTATGTYNITTTATNGMTFTASGTFTTTGVQTITLRGSGTPAAAGTFNIPVPGTPGCTFPLTVDAAPLVDWKFTVTNAPQITYQGQTDQAQLVPTNPPSVGFAMTGSNSAGTDNLTILLSDVSGVITAGETYSTSALPILNFAAFSYDLADGSDTYSADPTTTGASMTFTVTAHNVATKTITGTFSGTAKNGLGQTITITAGSFTATYL
ncbi:MAG: hypothetical protein RJA57_1127 [Bacteroidota bacterium]